MDNPFKNIIEHQQVPDILRERVMNDVRLIRLSLDFADLLAVKYPSSVISLLGTASVNGKKENKSRENKNRKKK